MEHLDPRIVRTREAVLDAATALLVEGGPDAVTMDGVVQRSGVAKSTIYRHWSGRDELLTEVFDHNAPHIETPPVELGFREALEYVMAQVVDALNDPRWSELMPALMLLKMHEAGPARLEAELKDEQAQALTEALRRGVAEGIVAEDCTRQQAMVLLIGPLVFARISGLVQLDTGLAKRAVTGFLAVYGTQHAGV